MLGRRFVGISSLVLAACGSRPAPSAPPAAKADPDAGATSDAGAPVERAFAGSGGEATQLINAQVDKKRDDLQKCVLAYRTRKSSPRESVSLHVGIDQEGRLLGVTMKGKKDEALTSCVFDALKALPFPRSHAGVITVTRTYEEIVQ